MNKYPYQYFRSRITNTLKFIIPEDKKVLILSSYLGKILNDLKPTRGVGVESDEKYYQLAKKTYPHLSFVRKSYENYQPNEKFDYIFLYGALGKTSNIPKVLKNLQPACNPSTRLIIYQHNYLWQLALSLAEKFSLKRKEGIENWLSTTDLRVYLEAAGFEVTRVFKRTLVPLFLFGGGPIINYLFSLIPFFDFLKLNQFIIARPKSEIFLKFPESLTVCITVRNERENIEKIVKSLPKVCQDQEILFVEGHSTDGTREEIAKVIKKYPSKNIRVIGQPGKGQGDAIRVGFKEARGAIIILYEGDGTSDPDDLYYFYEAMRKGRFEFIEGSRFVYPLSTQAMPLINKIGNIFFAKWFSFVLGQNTTDVLSGIKAIFKRDYHLLYERWGFVGLTDPFGDFELLFGAARMGLKIGEIPMRYYPRTYGQSKTNVFGDGLFLLKMALSGYWIFRSH